MVHSHRHHYEVLGCFLEWRLSSARRRRFSVFVLALPLEDPSAREWLALYEQLGLLAAEAGAPELELVSVQELGDANELRRFAAVLWPSADDPLLLASAGALGSRSLALTHARDRGPYAHPPCGLLQTQLGLVPGERRVLLPVHRGPPPAPRRPLRRPLRFCCLGLCDAEVTAQAVADGAQVSVVSRVCGAPARGQSCAANASVAAMLREAAEADAVLVAKSPAWLDQGLVSGAVGTAVSLLLPLVAPRAMAERLPFHLHSLVAYGPGESPTLVAEEALPRLSAARCVEARAAAIAHSMETLDEAVAGVLPELRWEPEALRSQVHCIWMEAGRPDFRGVPAKYADNLRRSRAVNGDLRLWNTPEVLELVREHFPQRYARFARLRPIIFATDVARLMIVAVHGGWYHDLDFVCVRPLAPLVLGASDYFMQEPREHSPARLCVTAFYCRAPGHPLLLAGIDALLDAWEDGAPMPFTPDRLFELAQRLGTQLRGPCEALGYTDAQAVPEECRLRPRHPFGYTLWKDGTGWGGWDEARKALRVVPLPSDGVAAAPLAPAERPARAAWWAIALGLVLVALLLR